MSPESISLAGGAIGAATIEALVKKGVLTHDDAIAILKQAQLRLSPFLQQGSQVPFDASQIIFGVIRDINKARP